VPITGLCAFFGLLTFHWWGFGAGFCGGALLSGIFLQICPDFLWKVKTKESLRPGDSKGLEAPIVDSLTAAEKKFAHCQIMSNDAAQDVDYLEATLRKAKEYARKAKELERVAEEEVDRLSAGSHTPASDTSDTHAAPPSPYSTVIISGPYSVNGDSQRSSLRINAS
jgi:hypothetical protein